MRGKEVNFGKLLHGGDYNPEQWLDYPEILEQDLAYFKKARINEVSLGMFSWAFLEPEEGVFRLEWLKEVIDRHVSMHKIPRDDGNHGGGGSGGGGGGGGGSHVHTSASGNSHGGGSIGF